MASLRDKEGSPYLYACVTLPDGRRLQYSTKIRSNTRVAERRKAQDLADRWERDVIRADNAQAAARLVQTLFEPHEIRERRHAENIARQIHRTVFGQGAENSGTTALGTYAESWLKGKTHEITPSTLHAYRSKIDQFVHHLGPDVALDAITRRTITHYRQHLLEKVSPPTVNAAIGILANLFADALRDDLITSNPCDHLKRLKTTPTARRPFTLPELRKVQNLASPEWQSIILFGFYTGQRLSDLAKLTWETVDLTTQEMRFHTSKTGRAMIIPIHPALLQHLTETLPSTDEPATPLHPRAHHIVTTQGNCANLSREFTALLGAAELKNARAPNKGTKDNPSGRAASPLSFHSLRHTATSLLKNAGISAPVVQELIGHASDAVNRLYTHIDADTLRQANAQLPEL